MKRVVIATFIVGVVTAYSQVVLLDKCYDLIQQKDLVNAESAALLAERNVVTANDARTYYLKAFIYKELYLQTTEPQRKDQLFNMAIMGVKKSIGLDRDNALKQPLKQLCDFFAATVYNEGTEHYNNQNYKRAIVCYKQFVELKEAKDENWLDANYFIGASYHVLHSNDSAEYYMQLVREKNYDEPILFVDLSYLLLEKSVEKALDVIKEGLSKYPDYFDLQIAELNILSQLQKYDTLEIEIDKFLGLHPGNVDVLLMAATTYEKLRTDDTQAKYFGKAEKVYLKIIAMDSLHYDANYNLGVLYYNEAVDIVNKSDLETNVQELNRILERSTILFEKSLPLLLRIFTRKTYQQTAEIKLLQALQAIYYNLNMKAELNNINTLIKAFNQ